MDERIEKGGSLGYHLFLDDFRELEDAAKYMPETPSVMYTTLEWRVVRNYKSFVRSVMRNGCPDVVSFDHDLCDEHILQCDAKHTNWTEYHKDDRRERTGYDAAKWLINYCQNRNIPFPQYYVHSQNPVGKENIISLIENYKKHENKINEEGLK